MAINGPWLQQMTTNSVTVMWEGDGAGSLKTKKVGGRYKSHSSIVKISPPRDEKDDSARIHHVHLKDLTPNTEYVYEVISGSDTAGPFTFRTHRTSGRFKIAATDHINGLRSTENRQAFFGTIIPYEPDAVIFTGDIGAAARNVDYRRLMTHSGGHLASLPISVGTGNHDTRANSRFSNWFHNKTEQSLPDETYHVEHIGNVRFVFLRDSGIEKGKRILERDFPKAWFRSVIESPTASDWTVLVHNSNLWIQSDRKRGFYPWFLELIKPYLPDQIDLIIGGGGGEIRNDPGSGLWYAAATNDDCTLIEVEGLTMSLRTTEKKLSNVKDRQVLKTKASGGGSPPPPPPPKDLETRVTELERRVALLEQK